jgi:hypothetical protein
VNFASPLRLAEGKGIPSAPIGRKASHCANASCASRRSPVSGLVPIAAGPLWLRPRTNLLSESTVRAEADTGAHESCARCHRKPALIGMFASGLGYCVWRTLIAQQSSAISKGLHSAALGRATSFPRSSGCAVIRMIGTQGLLFLIIRSRACPQLSQMMIAAR